MRGVLTSVRYFKHINDTKITLIYCIIKQVERKGLRKKNGFVTVQKGKVISETEQINYILMKDSIFISC